MSLIDQLHDSSDRAAAIEREFQRLRNAIIVRIVELVNDRDWSLDDLAERLNRTPEQIERHLDGHDLTLLLMVELEFIFGEPVIEVPRS